MKASKSRRKRVIVYDLAATREKFLGTGRQFRPYARLKGWNQESFGRFMSGDFQPAPGGETEREYLAALEADGLLVLKKKRATREQPAVCSQPL